MTGPANYTAAPARRSDAPQPCTCTCCHRPTAKRRTLWLIDGTWQCSRCYLALDGRPAPTPATTGRGPDEQQALKAPRL